MQQILVKRGLDLPMDGAAEKTLGSVNMPQLFRIVPDHYAGITPKLSVKAGERVKAGSPLFHDKTFEAMQFTSPVSGVVKEIVRVGIKLVTETALETLARHELGLTHKKILPHRLAVKAYNKRNLGLVEAV